LFIFWGLRIKELYKAKSIFFKKQYLRRNIFRFLVKFTAIKIIGAFKLTSCEGFLQKSTQDIYSDCNCLPIPVKL